MPVKALLDACVLYPTVLREILSGVGQAGVFTPLWSPRILEEWARAARKIGPTGEVQARAEVALLRAKYPKAEITPKPGTEARLWLPDPNDVHVLAAAIDGHADTLITFNIKDFPRQDLYAEGIELQNPDAFLYGLWCDSPDLVASAVAHVHAEAQRLSGAKMEQRALLKRIRLPRLAKALAS